VAIHFIARANEAGLDLSPQQLFNSPTIAELASVVDQLPGAPDSTHTSDDTPSAFEAVSLDEWQLSVMASFDESDDVLSQPAKHAG
jgi:hypothetical protein